MELDTPRWEAAAAFDGVDIRREQTIHRNETSPNISGTQNGGTHLYKLYGYGLCKGKALQGLVPPFLVPETFGENKTNWKW